MASATEVNQFLEGFKAKLSIWGIIYRDERPKNAQTLLTLDILPVKRTEILKSLTVENYAEGPKPESLYGGSDMWVFGTIIKTHEVYIKITMGYHGKQVICISFHIAENRLSYPLKK